VFVSLIVISVGFEKFATGAATTVRFRETVLDKLPSETVSEMVAFPVPLPIAVI